MSNPTNHPNEPVSFSEGKAGVGLPLQLDTQLSSNQQSTLDSGFSRPASSMTDSNGESRAHSRLRTTSYNSDGGRRFGLVSTHFASNDTVCVLNDQTGQSIVVASNQSTRDALASLCQRESEVERLEAAKQSYEDRQARKSRRSSTTSSVHFPAPRGRALKTEVEPLIPAVFLPSDNNNQREFSGVVPPLPAKTTTHLKTSNLPPPETNNRAFFGISRFLGRPASVENTKKPATPKARKPRGNSKSGNFIAVVAAEKAEKTEKTPDNPAGKEKVEVRAETRVIVKQEVTIDDSHKTDEELIAFLKEPLALAKAAEEEALRRRLMEPPPTPKRKSRAKSSTAAAKESMVNDETVRTDGPSGSRSKSTPSSAEPRTAVEDPDSEPSTSDCHRNFVCPDMPLGQALQEVPLRAVAGQLQVQKEMMQKNENKSNVTNNNRSPKQRTSQTPKPKPYAPPRKKNRKATEPPQMKEDIASVVAPSTSKQSLTSVNPMWPPNNWMPQNQNLTAHMQPQFGPTFGAAMNSMTSYAGLPAMSSSNNASNGAERPRMQSLASMLRPLAGSPEETERPQSSASAEMASVNVVGNIDRSVYKEAMLKLIDMVQQGNLVPVGTEEDKFDMFPRNRETGFVTGLDGTFRHNETPEHRAPMSIASSSQSSSFPPTPLSNDQQMMLTSNHVSQQHQSSSTNPIEMTETDDGLNSQSMSDQDFWKDQQFGEEMFNPELVLDHAFVDCLNLDQPGDPLSLLSSDDVLKIIGDESFETDVPGTSSAVEQVDNFVPPIFEQQMMPEQHDVNQFGMMTNTSIGTKLLPPDNEQISIVQYLPNQMSHSNQVKQHQQYVAEPPVLPTKKRSRTKLRKKDTMTPENITEEVPIGVILRKHTHLITQCHNQQQSQLPLQLHLQLQSQSQKQNHRQVQPQAVIDIAQQKREDQVQDTIESVIANYTTSDVSVTYDAKNGFRVGPQNNGKRKRKQNEPLPIPVASVQPMPPPHMIPSTSQQPPRSQLQPAAPLLPQMLEQRPATSRPSSRARRPPKRSRARQVYPINGEVSAVVRSKHARCAVNAMISRELLPIEWALDLSPNDAPEDFLDEYEEFCDGITNWMTNNPCKSEINVDDVLANPCLEAVLHGKFRKRLLAYREGRTKETTCKKRKKQVRPPKTNQTEEVAEPAYQVADIAAVVEGELPAQILEEEEEVDHMEGPSTGPIVPFVKPLFTVSTLSADQSTYSRSCTDNANPMPADILDGPDGMFDSGEDKSPLLYGRDPLMPIVEPVNSIYNDSLFQTLTGHPADLQEVESPKGEHDLWNDGSDQSASVFDTNIDVQPTDAYQNSSDGLIEQSMQSSFFSLASPPSSPVELHVEIPVQNDTVTSSSDMGSLGLVAHDTDRGDLNFASADLLASANQEMTVSDLLNQSGTKKRAKPRRTAKLPRTNFKTMVKEHVAELNSVEHLQYKTTRKRGNSYLSPRDGSISGFHLMDQLQENAGQTSSVDQNLTVRELISKHVMNMEPVQPGKPLPGVAEVLEKMEEERNYLMSKVEADRQMTAEQEVHQRRGYIHWPGSAGYGELTLSQRRLSSSVIHDNSIPNTDRFSDHLPK